MEHLIKTILGTEDNKYLKYIEILLDVERRQLLSKKEEEMLNYLYEIYDQVGKFPSEKYFLKQFPDFTGVLDSADELSDYDLEIHIKELVDIRSKQIVSREIMKIANRINSEGFTDESFDELRELYNLNRNVDDESLVLVEDTKDIYMENKDRPAGMLTFIDEIDKAIAGFNYGSVNTLIAWTGHYKSLLTTNIMYRNAYDLGYSIVMVSLEVPKKNVYFNVLARHSSHSKFQSEGKPVEHRKVTEYKLTDKEEEFLFDVVQPDLEENMEGNIIVLDETDFNTFSYGEIRAKLEEVDNQLDGNLDAVIWDHINLLRFTESVKNSYMGEAINMYTSFIRKLSMEFVKEQDSGDYRELINIIVAQVNRDGWRRAVRNGGAYDLRAISEANELERASHRVMSVFMDENLKNKNEALMQILKNRSGPVIYDPFKIHVNPAFYIASNYDEIEGANQTVDMGENADDFDILREDTSIDQILE